MAPDSGTCAQGGLTFNSGTVLRVLAQERDAQAGAPAWDLSIPDQPNAPRPE